MNEKKEAGRFQTIREIARSGLLPEYALRRLCAEGRLPGFYTGRKFLCNVALLKQWLEDPQSPLNAGRKEA